MQPCGLIFLESPAQLEKPSSPGGPPDASQNWVGNESENEPFWDSPLLSPAFDATKLPEYKLLRPCQQPY